MIKEYITYLKDNKEVYWFKAKLYGWGWVPAKWQGWVITLLYILFLTTLMSMREESIPGNPDSGSNFLVFGLSILIVTILFIFICHKKGEKPRWQWGTVKK